MLIICNGVFKSGSSWLHAIIIEVLKINKIQLNKVPKNYVKLGSPYYICYGERSAVQFLTAFKESGLRHSCNIIWKK